MKRLKKGFTLIELMIVVAILSILAVIAVSAYNGYQEKALEKEATAGLFSIASSAQQLIQDWGLQGAGGSIASECYPTRPNDLSSNTAVPWGDDTNDKWDAAGISLTGTQRWRYRLCFYVDANNNENYFVSANLLLENGRERVATLYSGLDKPLFDSESLPDNASGIVSWNPKLRSPL